jgi:hypothetical protein
VLWRKLQGSYPLLASGACGVVSRGVAAAIAHTAVAATWLGAARVARRKVGRMTQTLS